MQWDLKNFFPVFICSFLFHVSCFDGENKLLKKDILDARSAQDEVNTEQKELNSVVNDPKSLDQKNIETIKDSADSQVNNPILPPEDVPPPKNMEEAFQILSKSSNSSKAYKVNLKWYRPINFAQPDLSLSSSTSTFIDGSEKNFFITRWHRLDASNPCDLMMEYGDRAAPSLSTVAVYPTGCTPDLLLPKRSGYGLSRYGVRVCNSEKITFLGTKNIDSFLGAFGVRIECNRGEYFSLHEIWYHSASNHPYRKVLESGGYARPSIQGPIFPEIAQQKYENLADVKTANQFEINPPSFRMQYTLEGAVKSPGVKDGLAMCHLRSDGNFASVYIPMMPIFFVNGAQTIQGLWEPSFQVGSGTYSFGVFWNKNRFGQTIPNGNAAISFEKLGNTLYHRVSIAGFVSLLSKDKSNPNQYVGIKSISSFYCFANPESTGDATDFRDRNVGDVFDW